MCRFNSIVRHLVDDKLIQDTIQRLHEEQLPLRPRDLLCHSDNMSRVLTSSIGVDLTELKVHVLSCNSSGSEYNRIVSLSIHGLQRELAFIRIYLNSLPVHIHSDVVGGSIPFGAILLENNILQQCDVAGVFQLPSSSILDYIRNSDVQISDLEPTLYGRVNVLKTPDNQTIAEVMEVLLGN